MRCGRGNSGRIPGCLPNIFGRYTGSISRIAGFAGGQNRTGGVFGMNGIAKILIPLKHGQLSHSGSNPLRSLPLNTLKR